jgi:hypothetical protein
MITKRDSAAAVGLDGDRIWITGIPNQHNKLIITKHNPI